MRKKKDQDPVEKKEQPESSDKDKPNDPEAVLTNLLSKSLGTVARRPDATIPDNFLRIIILQKP